jgi:hypothetical protein
VRAPWTAFPDGALPAISDALLAAVAAPRHAPLPLALRFLHDESPDAAPVPFTSSPLLAQCAYLKDMVDVVGMSSNMAALSTEDRGEAPPAAPPLPVVPLPSQFSRADVEDLLRVAAGRDPDVARYPGALPAFLRSAEAYEERIAALVALADFLGAPERATASLRAAGAGGGRNRGDAMRIDADWARECMAAARAAEDGALDVIDERVAATLTHAPLLSDAPHDHRWLMHAGPRASAALPPGAPVLAAFPGAAAARALPRFVRAALASEAGHLALAGGAALAAVCAADLAHTASDYDLFVYGFTGDAAAVSSAADALVRRIVALPGVVDDGGRGVSVSRSAVTLRVEHEWDEEMDALAGVHEDRVGEESYVVQIVLRVASSPADIVAGFDLAPAKVMLLYETQPADVEEGAPPPPLTVLAAPEWRVAMVHRAFVVDGRCWSRATALRVFKYVGKGFDALIPVLRDRAAIRYTLPGTVGNARAWWRRDFPKLAHLDGFELLFAIERHLRAGFELEARNPPWRSYYISRAPTPVPVAKRRIRQDDVERIAAHLALEQRTDYASSLKMLRRWVYALQSARNAVLRFLGVMGGADALAAPLGWRQPWSRAQFHPVHADVLDALNLVDAPPGA